MTHKSPSLDASLVNSIEHSKRNWQILHKFFHKTEEGTLPSSFYEASINPDTKTKDTKRIPRNKLNQGGERTIL